MLRCNTLRPDSERPLEHLLISFATVNEHVLTWFLLSVTRLVQSKGLEWDMVYIIKVSLNLVSCNTLACHTNAKSTSCVVYSCGPHKSYKIGIVLKNDLFYMFISF